MNPALERIKKALAELEKKEIRVGFFDTAHYPDGTPIAYVAAIQEFGYGKIPPRPFLRPAQTQNKDKWFAALAKGVKLSFAGSVSIDMLLEQVALRAAGDVKKAIKAVTAPPLAQATLDARQSRIKSKKKVASAKPLVDTGQMLQAVTGAVVDR